MKKILNYIAGKLTNPTGGEFIDNINPATGQVYSLVANSKAKDVEMAVEAAKQAFPAWSQFSVQKRVEKLRRIAHLIENKADELARAESIDNGKPITLASAVDIPRAVKNLEYFANAITQFNSEFHSMDNYALNYTLRKPLGVVATISPWNLPLYLLTWKIAPALAAGNTVVAKPSEVTPMTAFLLSEICREADLPPGVLNIIHGEGPRLGGPLVTHPEVKAISFTGSTATGKIISQLAAPHFKKISLEMGGKNPNIIFADCDFDKALKTTLQATFANQGQICLCGSRIFIERPLYQKFKSALLEKISRFRQGNPLDPQTRQGAVVSQAHMQKILSYLELAKEEGGHILCGGKRFRAEGENAEGFFIQPTLIENLDPYCRTNQEEVFGPVASLTPFDEEKEVLEWANSTRYGLAATVWTKDISRAHRFARDLQSGIIWLNTWLLRDLRTPFGGMKDSGVGREGGFDALKFYTESKNICLKIDEDSLQSH